MRRIIITLCSWILSLIVGMPLLIGGGLIGFDADGRSARGSDTLSISTQIHEQVAVTTTTQVFTNSTMQASPAIYGFALPANAMVTKLRWKTRGTWYIAEMKGTVFRRVVSDHGCVRSSLRCYAVHIRTKG